MSKQKNPDKEKDLTPDVPKHASKRKKKPRRKRQPPKEYSCPFCGHVFKVKNSRFAYHFNINHPSKFKCAQCGAGAWGYWKKPEKELGWASWAHRDIWFPEYCTFCNAGAHFPSKDHYFRVWTSPEDDVYCDQCGFRGKIGGKRK